MKEINISGHISKAPSRPQTYKKASIRKLLSGYGSFFDLLTYSSLLSPLTQRTINHITDNRFIRDSFVCFIFRVIFIGG